MRSENWARSSEVSSSLRAAPSLARSSDTFMGLSYLPLNEHGAQGQLGGRERKRLPRQRLVHPVHLIEHLARLNFGDEVLRVALAVAHADLGRLMRHGLVGEDANPDSAATLDVAAPRAPAPLDLARRPAAAID